MFKLRYFALITLLSTILLSACGGASSDAPEAEEPAPEEPAEEAEPADDTAEDNEAQAATSLASLAFPSPDDDAINQFETQYIYVFTPEGGDTPTLTTNVTVATQAEPRAVRVKNTFDSSGFAEAEAAFSGLSTTLVVDGITYSIIEQDGADPTCFGSEASTEIIEQTFQANSFTNQLNPFDDTITQDFELVGMETVNGIEATHYQARGIAYGTYSEADVDIWQGSDGYVVKMLITGQTDDPTSGPGTVEIDYQVLSINQPIDFSIPDFC